MNRNALRFLVATLAALALTTPAHAIFRAYLASDGSDANPCTLPQPCRLLPAALAVVDPGGEIWMLDSANFNTAQVNVTKSVSILAIPGAVGSIVSTGGGHGLSIATASIRVSLRNLVFVALGTSNYGVFYSLGDEVVISQCEFANLNGTGGGVNAFGLSGLKLTIMDTLIRNVYYGVNAVGTNVTLERVRIDGASNAAVYAGNSTRLTIADSKMINNNVGASLYAGGGGLSQATISRTTFSASAGVAIYAATLLSGDILNVSLIENVITQNPGFGIQLYHAAGSTLALALDGNAVVGNGTGFVAAVGTPTIYSRGNNSVKLNSGGDAIPSPLPWAGQ